MPRPMNDDELYQTCAPQVLKDPAVVAAQDQLRAAATDSSNARADDAEDQAIGAILDVIVRRALDAMGVPRSMAPEVLEHAARYIERRFATDGPAGE